MNGFRAVLHVEHGWGGGILRHINDLSGWLALEGIRSFRAVPTQNRLAFKILPIAAGQAVDQEFIVKRSDPEAAVKIISEAGIDHIHIHSLIGYHQWLDDLFSMIKSTNIEYDFTIHDYTTICPRIHMVDTGKIYCNSLSPLYCEKCISIGGTPFGQVDIDDWRGGFSAFIRNARRIFVPNRDVERRMREYLSDDVDYTLKPHPEHCSEIEVTAAGRGASKAHGRVIGVMGPLVLHKGSHVVHALAEDALNRNIDIKFVVFGETNMEKLYRMKNVVILGKYEEDEIDGIIQDNRPEMMLLPSICPETFSYALSIAFRNKIFPVSFDIGAIADRIRSANFGLTVPLAMAFRPQELTDLLVRIPGAGAEGLDDRSWMTKWTDAKTYYDY